MHKICLPLISSDLSTICSKVTEQSNEYDLFEIWIDYLDNPDLNKIIALTTDFADRIILVSRRLDSQPLKASKDERLATIEALFELPIYLDLDITSQRLELEFLMNLSDRPKLIVSYHNYAETPELEKLIDLATSMQEFSPFATKLATYCLTKSDALTLLRLSLELKKHAKHFIVLGMGEEGLVTRIAAPIWYNWISYAPLSVDSATADGQLTKSQLDMLISIYSRNRSIG